MFGKIEVVAAVILGISILAVFTDVKWGKIFNWTTFPTILSGIAYAYLNPTSHVSDSLLGILAGLFIFGWMFALRFLGGGDVKLLMAFGAWGGWHLTLEIALLAILLGGALSLLSLLVRGKLWKFAQKLYYFFLSLWVQELDPTLPKIDKSLTLPFAVPMALAAVWTLAFHPLAGMV